MDGVNNMMSYMPLESLQYYDMKIKKYINEQLYGYVDGMVDMINNTKATHVRDYGFYQHQSLQTAEFLNATRIGDYSFYKCPCLTVVSAPACEGIGIFAFRGSSLLNSVNYPLATTVGQGAFDDCTSLSNVVLPMVTVIEPLTFRKCEALTTIDLPMATSIFSQAFYSSGLSSLTLRANTVCTLEDENALAFTPIEEGTGYIYVPSNLVDSYKSANGWSVYANQIRAIA